MSAVNKEQRSISKVQKAYDMILNKILSGELAPGMSLSERELSELLQLSRTPVKDALNRLSFEGYVDMFPDKGATVSKIGLPEVLELYEIRGAVEGLSARLAATRRSEKDIERMQNSIAQHRTCIASGAIEAAQFDDEFHIDIAQASRNTRLAAQIELVIRQCRRAAIFQNQHNPQRVEKSIQQHEAILQAIIGGQAEEASRAMDIHMNDVITSTKELMLQYYFMYR